MSNSTKQFFPGIVLAMVMMFALNITAHAMEPESGMMMEKKDSMSMMHGDSKMTPEEMIDKGEKMIEEGKAMKMKGEEMKKKMMMEKDRM